MPIPENVSVDVTAETIISTAPSSTLTKAIDTIHVVIRKRDCTNARLTDHIRKAIDDAIESFEP